MNLLIASNPHDRQLWLSIWSRIDDREVYAHPEYVALYEDASSKAACAYIDNDAGIIMFPFLIRDIPSKPYHDLISPYGYGGCLICSKNPDMLIRQFYTEFGHWALENNIVSEFVRFYLSSPCIQEYYGEVLHNNNNIIVDLTRSVEERWMSYRQKVRKNVKKATGHGVIISDDTGARLNNFLDIYYSTMKRREAKDSYYFPKQYFEAIVEKLSGLFHFFYAEYEDKIISTELVLVSENNIYSFLGGTIEEYFDVRPNDLLKHEIMNWGSQNNKKSFVLGGGYTPDDGIFRYKEAFAPDGSIPFHIGRKVFNNKIYTSLVDERKKVNPDSNYNSEFFPLYRI